MFKILKKADIVLFILLLLIGGAFSVLGLTHGQADSEDKSVVIHASGKVYGTYDLNENREILIESSGHLNKVIIKDGTVQMAEASCHNQVCVNQGVISKVNQRIICLPNRVVVEITGSGVGGEPDVISG